MGELRRLLLDRGDHARVAVPDVQHRDAGQEVEVLVALVVPEPHALAAHELDRVADVRRDRVFALERLQFGEAHGALPSGRIIVP